MLNNKVRSTKSSVLLEKQSKNRWIQSSSAAHGLQAVHTTASSTSSLRILRPTAQANKDKAFQAAQRSHNQHTSFLPMLQTGSLVILQDPHTGLWNQERVVTKVRKDKLSYTEQVGNRLLLFFCWRPHGQVHRVRRSTGDYIIRYDIFHAWAGIAMITICPIGDDVCIILLLQQIACALQKLSLIHI